MKPKLISVIIPAYNAEKYLAEALDSVFAQDYSPFEVIVIDDGSTDDTAGVVERYSQPGIRYHYQPNGGIAAARNTGINMAQGDWIAFIDADDLWMPHRLSAQVELLQEFPEAEFISGKVRQFISPDVPEEQRKKYRIHAEDVQVHLMTASLIKRDVFNRVGPFNPDLLIAQDMEWVKRAQEMGVVFIELDRLVFLRRQHSGNIGRRNPEENYSLRFQILKDAIDHKKSKNV